MSQPAKDITPDNVLYNLNKDQMSEQGTPTDLAGQDRRKADELKLDLDVEDKQWQNLGIPKDGHILNTSPTLQPSMDSEENDYCNGMGK